MGKFQIEVQNLSKFYGSIEAVKDVSFSLGAEQVLGFLGPNGAGKTTVMKVLTGFHFPSSGKAYVGGIPVDEAPVEVKKLIGYLPESVPLYGDLTVDEYLEFAAQARLIPKQARRPAIDASLEACALGAYRGRKIETLSKGYRQRTGLAQAILHDPPILILDEPTTGLDPNQIIEIRALIKELGKRKTVILSTHILQEVEAVCSQVLIINEGRIAAQGRPEEIAGTMKGGVTWELVVKGAGLEAIKGKLAKLDSKIKIASAAAAEGLAEISFLMPGEKSDNAGAEKIFDWAVSEGLKILGMSRKKLSIEDIFVKLTVEQSSSEQSSNEHGSSEQSSTKRGKHEGKK